MVKNKTRKPFYVEKLGNVRCAIYRREQVKAGKQYVTYTVVDHTNGLRKFHTFADLVEAKDLAVRIVHRIWNGEGETAGWSDRVRAL